MPLLHAPSQQLADLPRLRRPMAQVAIPAVLIRRMQMRVEHLDGPPPRAQVQHRARHALPGVPVAAPEGRGPPVEHVGVHAGLDDGEAAQHGQARADEPAAVELCVGQHARRRGAQGRVVAVHP